MPASVTTRRRRLRKATTRKHSHKRKWLPPSSGGRPLLIARCPPACWRSFTPCEGIPNARRHNLCQAYARLGHASPPPASESYYQKAFAQAEMVAAIERRTPAFGREMSTSMLVDI